MAFKRKRIYAPRANAFKKRKSYRKKRMFKRGGGKTIGYTSLNTRDHRFGFRSKKTSRRAYRKHLWDSTLFSSHYRSIASASTSVATLTSPITGTTFGLNLSAPIGTANPFWTTSGGLIPLDNSVAAPLFQGDITLRGGVWEVIFYNTSTTNDVRIKVWNVFTMNRPNLAFFPANPSIAWDPSASAEFNEFIGKPFNGREVVIEQGNSYTIKGRMKIQKIDERVYGDLGKCLFLFGLVHTVGAATACTVNINYSLNCSFSADAIGTT